MRQQAHRRTFLYRYIGDLHEMGYQLTDIKNLKKKHIRKWFQAAEGKIDGGTLQTYASFIHALCLWIGKKELIEDPRNYFTDPDNFNRVYVDNVDKTETNPNATVSIVDMMQRLYDRSPQVEATVQLMLHFGLRFEEAVKFRPNIDDRVEMVRIQKGTKGGQPRVVPIETAEQRVALVNMKDYAVSKNGTTIPKEKTYEQWMNHIRYQCRVVGFTKRACGYTPHSLRHGYANRIYAMLTGVKSRVKGGFMSQKDRGNHKRASLNISKRMGHHREAITTCYLGSAKWIGKKCPKS